MTPAEILAERARLTLEAVRERGLRATVPNLENQAQLLFPELLSADWREIGYAALYPNGTAAAPTVERLPAPPAPPVAPTRARTTPSAARAPAADASRPLERRVDGPAVGAGGQKIRDFLELWLPKHPKATAGEAWEAVQSLGPIAITRKSFDTMCFYRVRRVLEAKIEKRDLSQEPPRPTGRKAPRPTDFLPAPARAAAPEERATDHSAPTPDAAGDESPDRFAMPQLVPSSGWSAPRAEPAAADTSAGTTHANGNGAAPSPVTNAGKIEIEGGGARFLATKREDGGWDVDLSMAADTELMDKLAEVVWKRSVLSEALTA